MKCIPSSWPQDSNSSNVDLFDTITEGLLGANTVPKFGMRSMSAILSVLSIVVCGLFILKCFTKQLLLMIFYLKLTAKIPLIVIFVINFQNLLFIIISVNVIFVRPIWEELFKIIKDKHDVDFTASNFEKTFGVFGDKFLTY